EQAWVAVAELEDRAERIPVLETELEAATRSHAAAMSDLATHKRQIRELEGAVAQNEAQLAVKAHALEQGGQQRRGIEAALALIEQSGSYRLARVVSRCFPRPLKRAYRRLWRRRLAVGGNGDISSLTARGDDLRLSLVVPVSSNGEHLRAKIEACLAQTRPGDQVILAGDHPTQPAVRAVLNEYKNRPGVTIVLDEANGAGDTELPPGDVDAAPADSEMQPGRRAAADQRIAWLREPQAEVALEACATRSGAIEPAVAAQALDHHRQGKQVDSLSSASSPHALLEPARIQTKRRSGPKSAPEPGSANERLPSSAPGILVSVVVICWNNRQFLKRCFDSLARTHHPNIEVFLADNASVDGSAAFVAEHYPNVRVVVHPSNLGFAEGNNRVIRLCKGEYIVTLNPDTEVDPDWIGQMLAVAERDPTVGMVSPKMYIMDQGLRLNSAGGDMLLRSGDNLARAFYLLDDGRFDKIEESFGPSAGAGFYRRAMLEDIGLFDRGLFTYYEDVDLNMRAQLRGYRCLYTPHAVVYHYQSGTMDDHNPLKMFLLQRNKWYVVLKTFPLSLFWRCRKDLARSYIGAMRHLREAGQSRLPYRILLSLVRRSPRILALRLALTLKRRSGSSRRIAKWMDIHEDTYRELDQAAAVTHYYEDLRRRGDASSSS
ncbi:MAG: glycosyltransferase, partial [Dehalococcoidia bacterium]